MKTNDQGIRDTSELFFHTGSATAKRLYFYPLCTGHYFCDSSYVVSRQNYNSFLIIYVRTGSGFVEVGGKQMELKVGAIAFIDCYLPHRYYTKTGWEIYWVHFDGVLARQYFEIATKESIVLTPSNFYQVESSLRKLFKFYKDHTKVNEAILSKYIIDILTELILCVSSVTTQHGSVSVVDETIAYISQNADKPITVEELASRVFLSLYYFIRVFKRETGYTPYEYIIRVRVDFARFLLKTTSSPIKDIAYKSGFNSESSFCTTFKKICGMTPTAYRED